MRTRSETELSQRRPRDAGLEQSATFQSETGSSLSIQVPDRSPPSPLTHIRRDDIQGLRGVAVALVVAFHAGLAVSGGYAGVDMFFVISGFVITALLVRELESNGNLNFIAFYSRRARRLLPALALVLLVVAVASVVLLSPLSSQQRTAQIGVATALFGANAVLIRIHTGYFDAPIATMPLLHTWSLAVEEQFYLFFPALLAATWSLGRRFAKRVSPRATAFVLVAAIGLASFAMELLLTPSHNVFAFYASPTRAWEFAAGGLVALAMPAIGRIPVTAAVVLGISGAGLLIYTSRALNALTIFPGRAALIPVAGTTLVIVAGGVSSRGVSNLLRLRPLVWTGNVSYGWYLWHWPAIVFAQVLWPSAPSWYLPAVGLSSLAPTWASYRLIENPIRFDTLLTGRRVLPLAAACLAIPITASVALYGLARIGPGGSSNVTDFRAAGQLHVDAVNGCEQSRPIGHTNPDCTWTVPHPRGTIVLIGDSNAGQFAEPAIRAANAQGYDLTVAASSGCPFADLVTTYTATQFDAGACRRFVTGSIAGIARTRPHLVIIASSSLEYLHDGNGVGFRDPTSGGFASTSQAKAALWTKGEASILQQITQAGVPALLVHTIPHFAGFDLLTCPGYRMFLNIDACGKSLTRAAVDASQRLALNAEEAALGEVPAAAGVDFTPNLCTPDTCSTERSNLWLYRDGAHLSVPGALTLTPQFIDLVRLHSRVT